MISTVARCGQAITRSAGFAKRVFPVLVAPAVAMAVIYWLAPNTGYRFRWITPGAVMFVIVWIVAVGSAIRNLESIYHLLGYAGGFATGSVVGLIIEEKLAVGLASIQVISRHGGVELAQALLRGRGDAEHRHVADVGRVAPQAAQRVERVRGQPRPLRVAQHGGGEQVRAAEGHA